MNDPFNPQLLAADFSVLQRIYTEFFNNLTATDWTRPVKGAPREWNLAETVAHLCALSGAGLESIEAALRGENYVFSGLENRYQFNDYNRKGIDAHLGMEMRDLCAEFVSILERCGQVAAGLTPAQAQITADMPIYNRPLRIVEALGIIMFHAGLHHSAQVAEPARVVPLWQQLSPEIRHRVIGRVMRALSLLYRFDLGNGLHGAFIFEIGGPGGGVWHVTVAPDSATSEEGPAPARGLTLRLRDTGVFCRMFTGRMNLLPALLSGQIRLSGNLRLFPRFGSLFSVDARPS